MKQRKAYAPEQVATIARLYGGIFRYEELIKRKDIPIADRVSISVALEEKIEEYLSEVPDNVRRILSSDEALRNMILNTNSLEKILKYNG